MANKVQLEKDLKYFEKSGKTPEDLNVLRTAIFDSFDKGDIREATKVKLLKDLYLTATLKNIFFLRVMDRVPGLPKNDEEERRLQEQEEEAEDSYSYEESYSYDEDDEENQ